MVQILAALCRKWYTDLRDELLGWADDQYDSWCKRVSEEWNRMLDLPLLRRVSVVPPTASLSEEEMHGMRVAFRRIDVDDSGTIDGALLACRRHLSRCLND